MFIYRSSVLNLNFKSSSCIDLGVQPSHFHKDKDIQVRVNLW